MAWHGLPPKQTRRATIKISASRPIQCGASPLTTRRDTRRFGAHALHLRESGAQFDVVITDYAMPAMTGLDLATKIKHIKPAMPASSPPATPSCRRR
jgi:CheY-like chemotaxis protein